MITVALAGREGREAFEGPLDLLLALVRRGGYPLDRLPVGEITRQYHAYLTEARGADQEGNLELDGDYLEIASWLVLLKSRVLLPPAPGEAGEEPPAQELARALLDHAALKRAAALLGGRLDTAGLGPGLGASGEAATGKPEPPGEPDTPTVADVLQAARRALDAARAHARAADALPTDPYPVEHVFAALDAQLRKLPPGRGVSTAPWFEELPDTLARAALLLALLELAHMGEVLLHQHTTLGPLLLQPVAGKASGRN